MEQPPLVSSISFEYTPTNTQYELVFFRDIPLPLAEQAEQAMRDHLDNQTAEPEFQVIVKAINANPL